MGREVWQFSSFLMYAGTQINDSQLNPVSYPTIKIVVDQYRCWQLIDWSFVALLKSHQWSHSWVYLTSIGVSRCPSTNGVLLEYKRMNQLLLRTLQTWVWLCNTDSRTWHRLTGSPHTHTYTRDATWLRAQKVSHIPTVLMWWCP